MAESAPFIVDTSPTAVAPGSAGFLLPPEATFQTRFNVPWNTWPRQFDEAILDNPDNARRMRNDLVITTPLSVRTRATVLQTWHIEPDDPENEQETKAAADVEWRIRQMPNLLQMLTTLLWDGIFIGRSAAQAYYQWQRHNDVTGLKPIGYDPINGDKLVFGYGKNRGRVGVRVWNTYKGKKEQTEFGFVKWFDGEDRNNLVTYAHQREDADYTQWQKSGALFGTGLRDRLYWTWSLKNQVLAFLMDYLQWFARGLTIYYYDQHNLNAYSEVVNRVNEHTKSGLPVLIFPRERDGSPNWKPVERLEPGQAGNNLIIQLITGYFDDLFRRETLGQDATTVASGSSALGDGRAELHQTTFDHIVKWDSTNLGEYLSLDFVRVIYAWTYPGMSPGKWLFETESPNVPQLLESSRVFAELGGQIDGEALRKELGLPLPKPGAQLLGQAQPLQPQGLTEIPEGTPVVTPPGVTQPGPVS